MYYDVIPLPEQSWFVPTPWTSSRLYLNMATNFAGFYATALLTSYLSEKLQKTSRSSTRTGRTWPSCARSIRTSSSRSRPG